MSTFTTAQKSATRSSTISAARSEQRNANAKTPTKSESGVTKFLATLLRSLGSAAM